MTASQNKIRPADGLESEAVSVTEIALGTEISIGMQTLAEELVGISQRIL
jgi:hypothetical protein